MFLEIKPTISLLKSGLLPFCGNYRIYIKTLKSKKDSLFQKLLMSNIEHRMLNDKVLIQSSVFIIRHSLFQKLLMSNIEHRTLNDEVLYCTEIITLRSFLLHHSSFSILFVFSCFEYFFR